MAEIFSKLIRSATGIIVISLIFLITNVYVLRFFDFSSKNRSAALFLAVFVAVIAMGVLPYLAIRFVFKSNPREFGFRFPENFNQSLILSLLAFCVLVLPVLIFSRFEVFRSYYAFQDLSLSSLMIIGIILPFFYYLAEEFFFRGFLFWGLWRNIKYDSFWLTSFIFALFHIGKPPPEIVYAFLAGLVLAYLGFRAKSFLPPALVHFALAVVLNTLVTFF
jgi:membrane protease YdiL (CAAX protease family)